MSPFFLKGVEQEYWVQATIEHSVQCQDLEEF